MSIFSLRFLPPCLLGLLFAGCATYTDLPPGTVREVAGVETVIVEREVVTVEPTVALDPPPADYLLGPGDVLFVNVSGRPDLGSPVVTGGKIQGSRIDGAGNLHLPLVGDVAAAGLSINELQWRLREVYASYLQAPWLVVEIAEYKSQPLYLLGQFRESGTHYMDRPLSLLQGLALGKGLLDSANLRSARLIRDGRTAPVDLFSLLNDGDARQNVWLRPGDTIFVPDDRNQNVFVYGAVAKAGPVPMPNGQLTLPQALTAAGLGEVRAKTRYIRIIRSLSTTRGELLVVDLDRVMRGEVLPYPLHEGDIIYVPRSAVGNWNQVIGEILPTLQATSAILQPFVQIKYLNEDN
jgi:polysaccharide export outer membrane protein